MNPMTVVIKGEGVGWNSCHPTPFFSIPTVNMTETGKNINRMRIEADMSVKDMQQVFGFTTPQAIYNRMWDFYYPCNISSFYEGR